MADRPGFMMYFDFAPALSRLTDEEAGKLFKAIMDYASSGNVYDLPGICGFAFEVIRPRIDKDRETYEEKCRKNSYSTYVREAKKKGDQPLDYESWISKVTNDIERYQPTSNDIERYPTTTQLQLNSNTNQINSTTTTTTTENIGEADATDASPHDPVAAVWTYYLNRVNPQASQFSLDMLKDFAENMGEDVCKRAIDIAIDNKKPTWSYIKAILQAKTTQGVKCLADWDALEEKREEEREKKAHASRTGAPQDYGKPEDFYK